MRLVCDTEQIYINAIRKNIKERMEKEEMSINTLASKTGLAKSTLSAYFAGEIACLTAAKIALIADALETPIAELFRQTS